MYWNNTWLNNFNSKIFFSKTLFLDDIFIFIFSDKIFKSFFFNKEPLDSPEEKFFKNFFLKRSKKNFSRKNAFFFKKNKKKTLKVKYYKYNFSKLHFIKYNNHILITTFVFFYFKIKSKKKNQNLKNLQKAPLIFWRKRRGKNIKKKIFLLKQYINF